MRLHKQGGAFWINAQGQQLCGAGNGAVAQLFWFLIDGNRVEIWNEVEGIVGILQVNPLLDCSQVIAQVIGIGGGLNSRKDSGSGLCGEIFILRRHAVSV